MTREEAIEILETARKMYPGKSVIRDAFTLALSTLHPVSREQEERMGTMRGINKQTMLDLIIEAKRNEPEDVRFSDWLAEYLADRLSTLTPPNEPLTIDKKRVIAESCLHYGKSGRCGLNGYAPLDCPRCKEWHSNESNEPLTIEQLREMDKITPVWWTRNGCRCLCERGYITMPNGDIYGADEMNGLFYRRPPEVSP